MKLYELTKQMKGLQLLIDEGELLEDDLSDTLDGLTGDLIAKGGDVLLFMANLAGDIAAFDSEIKRMAARKKTLQKNHDYMKWYLRTNMAECGITKIESPVFTATLRKPTKIVEIINEDEIPVEYQTMIPASWKINKVQILRDLKTGKEIPGVKLGKGKPGIMIK